MANQTIVAAKAVKVAEIKEKLANAQSVVFVDYRGYTVEEDTELRSNFRKAGVEYAVIKNTYMERACADAGIDEAVNAYFAGPTAVAFGHEDAVAPAKTIRDFVKKSKKGVIRGGIVNGKVVDAAARQIDAIDRIERAGKFDTLSADLKETARLRREHSMASLSELAAMFDPPISKPSVNNRLRRLIKISEELEQ